MNEGVYKICWKSARKGKASRIGDVELSEFSCFVCGLFLSSTLVSFFSERMLLIVTGRVDDSGATAGTWRPD